MDIRNQSILPNRDPGTGRLKGQFSPASGDRPGTALPEYDIITIGGGINGSGIARDAAERGLKVLMLDKTDFGAGTSAYSSRLIHGGLRYLENFELDLVHESLQERERLLKNAPHLVKPLLLGIPIYQDSDKGKWLVKMGMWLYDLLSYGKSVPNHRMYGRKEFIEKYPGVKQDGLVGGPVYYDAQVEFPERICVENAMAAKETGNATVLNHAQVTGIVMENRQAAGVRFTDLLTGEEYTARAKVIINAAGPWVDDVLKLSTGVDATKAAADKRRIGGTKGSHIIVKKFPGGPETALYVEAESDGRPFFIIPWRKNYYLIGTTDLHYNGDLDKVVADRDEVAYLLKETNRVLPGAGLSQQDVLYTYSGVRPLPYAGDKKAGKITRKHIIEDHVRDGRRGLVSIIGGKLTTYRNLAEEAVDYAIKRYGLKLPDGKKPGKTTTRDIPLPGGRDLGNLESFKQRHADADAADYGVPPETVAHLIDLYGSRYRRVLALTQENPLLKEPLHPGSPDIGAQVVYAVREEFARTVADVLMRRIGSGLDADAGLDAAEPTARIMARELGWDQSRLQQELETYRNWVQSTNLAFRHA